MVIQQTVFGVDISSKFKGGIYVSNLLQLVAFLLFKHGTACCVGKSRNIGNKYKTSHQQLYFFVGQEPRIKID